MAERGFVDEARVHVAAGKGGDGSMSFRREKYQPKGPPDGGNGGGGGSVIFRVDPNIATLSDIARHPHIKATRGANGSSNTRHGAAGEDRVVLVPDGTVVTDEDGALIADLVGDGVEAVIAAGGRGGRGNASLASREKRAPAFAELGEEGIERWVGLELKLLADVGLVGFPNAGKSSLTARMSAARPKIASYPFTTLTPNLGVAETADGRFVVADVPGLIEGASQGRGLGLAFLRHLERTRVLCFVLDVAAPEDPAASLRQLRAELRAHDASFDTRVGVVAANKIDLPDANVDAARAAADEAGFVLVAVSAETGEGVESLLDALAAAIARADTAAREPTHRLVKLRPTGDEVEIVKEDDAWRVHHAKAERLFARFDIGNAEALIHLQERLVAFGVEAALAKAGARAGDEVRIGDTILEYTPDEEVGKQ